MSDSDEPDERDYPDDFDWTSREGQDEAYDWACDNWDAAPSAIPPHDGFVTPRGRVFPWGQGYGGLLISMSPLREVMQRGDVDALRALHEGEQGPLDLDQRFGWLGGHEEKECVRLCFLSAERGHTAMIIYMIEQGADVVSSGRYDFDGIHIVSTPLDNTAFDGPIELIEVLLDAGAHINAVVEPYGESPLEAACDWYGSGVSRDGSTVKLLIRRGAVLRDERTSFGDPSTRMEWGTFSDPWVEDVFNRGGYRAWLCDKRLRLIGLRTLLDGNRAAKKRCSTRQAGGQERQQEQAALAWMFPASGETANTLPKDCVCIIIAFLVDSASSPALGSPAEVSEAAWGRSWNARHEDPDWKVVRYYQRPWSQTSSALRQSWRGLFTAEGRLQGAGDGDAAGGGAS